MAEIIVSAVASEAVSRVVSSFLSGDGDKASHDQESVEDKAERLEMAVLKIRSVVAVSEDLHISHLPLLQWKAKLKRVADEGDDLLHVHKKQTPDSACNNRVSDSSTTGNNSISQYLIQAAKRFVPFRRKEDELRLSDSTLRRFERLADGAADSFFRLVESAGGGHPNKSVFLPSSSLTRTLLAGDSMELEIQTKTGNDRIMLWPWLDHPQSGSGLEACLFVSREDEVMWQKGFKLCIMFRLSEASNILAIAMSCLDLLPPQFDAARVAISGLLTETIGQSGDHDYSCLSERSKWCCRKVQSYHRNDCEPSMGDKHRGNGLSSHADAVLRSATFCYSSPCVDRKDGLVPLELECHVSPYLLPEKHSSQYELVEHDDIQKLLQCSDAVYDDERYAAFSNERQIWSSQSSMYCAVAPVYTQPLTLSQAYKMECFGTCSRRRKAKTKSQSISKFQKIAKA